MERVAKFYFPDGLSRQISAPGVGVSKPFSAAVTLPIGLFPLPPSYQANFRWVTIEVAQPAGSTAVGSIESTLFTLNGALGQIVTFPGFPVAPSSVLAAGGGAETDFFYPVLPPPMWEWNDFDTVGSSPVSLQASAVISLSAAGNIIMGFNAFLEVWKI